VEGARLAAAVLVTAARHRRSSLILDFARLRHEAGTRRLMPADGKPRIGTIISAIRNSGGCRNAPPVAALTAPHRWNATRYTALNTVRLTCSLRSLPWQKWTPPRSD
jgi:hypothetical protein